MGRLLLEAAKRKVAVGKGGTKHGAHEQEKSCSVFESVFRTAWLENRSGEQVDSVGACSEVVDTQTEPAAGSPTASEEARIGPLATRTNLDIYLSDTGKVFCR